jgi:GNAT superfamily N-acetyltransferase
MKRSRQLPHPIHVLSASHRPDLVRHFCALGADDRHLRFGSAMTDAAVKAYVQHIDFDQSEVLAVLDDRLRVIGVAHLAYCGDTAEIGFSVLKRARGKGVGSALFTRATAHLTNRFIGTAYIHCLRENGIMMHLARKNQMRVVVDGTEADAYLQLPHASPESITAEWMESRLALIDYSLKVSSNAAMGMLHALTG